MDRDTIKAAVGEAIEEKLGPFFVEREKHYKHHEFIDGVLCVTEKIKGQAIKTLTTTVVTAILALIVLGIGFWMKGKIH